MYIKFIPLLLLFLWHPFCNANENLSFDDQFYLSLARIEYCYTSKQLSINNDKNQNDICGNYYWGDLYFLVNNTTIPPRFVTTPAGGVDIFRGINELYDVKIEWINWLLQTDTTTLKNNWERKYNPNVSQQFYEFPWINDHDKDPKPIKITGNSQNWFLELLTKATIKREKPNRPNTSSFCVRPAKLISIDEITYSCYPYQKF
ncbi:hypothetical protein [Stenoxybacter acetivorans]|uniref:hypothetical protein n=1 Tax=Stenoxybacter acetivorans TaxID=422441 RepID=UPI0012EB0738|nr:hypothetical protein [Stenoxybacter acetivorans]